jgi:redox-sensing transcriptional repressor
MIERLALYRRLLKAHFRKGKTHVYSHQLAEMAGSTSAVVRRDLMNLGYYGTPRHGYEIKALLDCLDRFFHKPDIKNLIIIGAGNLGRALISYFSQDKAEYNLVAAFDVDSLKINLKFNGCPCYPLEKLDDVISDEKVSIAIITVPTDSAQEIADRLVKNQISGILNFAPVSLTVPESIYVENVDLALMLEKTIYFSHYREKEPEEEKAKE